MKLTRKNMIWGGVIAIALIVIGISVLDLVRPPSAGVSSSQPLYLAQEPLEIRTSSGAAYRFNVEVARSNLELNTGLMHRKALDANAGMLYAFADEDIRHFWMKDTHIPLDMIFVDRRGFIVDIHANASPLSTKVISSQRPAMAVLEINGGRASQLGLTQGDRLVHPAFTQ